MRDQRRKPLVIMTPKSLLRHPQAVSGINEFTSGRFNEVIDDSTIPDASPVSRLILCSGKIYYDLLAARKPDQMVPIIRIEQLYPFPSAGLRSVLHRYPHAREVVWTQEEPMNMGGWVYVRPIIEAQVSPGQALSCISRPAAASPATGSLKTHLHEQENIVRQALGETDR
jgi:2-oxoglutarate dehydrogenase E1 component